MAIATATTIVESLLALLANSRPTIDEINAACLAKGLPPAFTGSSISTQVRTGILGALQTG
jgi:hypothetical protein